MNDAQVDRNCETIPQAREYRHWGSGPARSDAALASLLRNATAESTSAQLRCMDESGFNIALRYRHWVESAILLAALRCYGVAVAAGTETLPVFPDAPYPP